MNEQNTFPGRMIGPLDELAHQLLPLKQYGRLRIVVELLAAFSRGGWDRVEDEVKLQLIDQMERDFHVRAWDDWDWTADGAFARINEVISAEKKALTRK